MTEPRMNDREDGGMTEPRQRDAERRLDAFLGAATWTVVLLLLVTACIMFLHGVVQAVAGGLLLAWCLVEVVFMIRESCSRGEGS